MPPAARPAALSQVPAMSWGKASTAGLDGSVGGPDLPFFCCFFVVFFELTIFRNTVFVTIINYMLVFFQYNVFKNFLLLKHWICPTCFVQFIELGSNLKMVRWHYRIEEFEVRFKSWPVPWEIREIVRNNEYTWTSYFWLFDYLIVSFLCTF